jgi:hypothetical protein
VIESPIAPITCTFSGRSSCLSVPINAKERAR